MSTDLDTATQHRRHVGVALTSRSPLQLIGGSWGPSNGQIEEDQFNPSTGERTGSITHSSLRDVDDAVASAQRGARLVAAESAVGRLARVRSLRSAVAEERTRLVHLITSEAGRTVREAHRELDLADRLLAWIGDPANWAGALADDFKQLPLGVAAGISLYHYSVVSPLWMAVPALAAGNGYVLRPCTWSPATGAAVGRLIADNFPAEALNVVQGGIEVVDRLLQHPDVAAISYVGSGPWARHMQELAGPTAKRVQSMGAVRHVTVVAQSADLDAAAAGAVAGLVDYAGQRWLGGNTVVVDEQVADQLVACLIDRLSAVRVGGASDTSADMGPVVRQERLADLATRLRLTDPGDVVVDGRSIKLAPGYFLGPTMVDGVGVGSSWWLDEVPGPVLTVIRSTGDAFEQVVGSARQALVGSVYATPPLAGSLAATLPFSMVAVNRPLGEIAPGLPFAVWSPGFFGAHYWNGADQIRFFTRPKVIVE